MITYEDRETMVKTFPRAVEVFDEEKTKGGSCDFRSASLQVTPGKFRQNKANFLKHVFPLSFVRKNSHANGFTQMQRFLASETLFMFKQINLAIFSKEDGETEQMPEADNGLLQESAKAQVRWGR